MKVEPFPSIPVFKKSPNTHVPASLNKVAPTPLKLIDLKNSSAASEVMQKYDLSQISQHELENMAKDLAELGAITEENRMALISSALFAPVKASKKEYETWANKKFNVLEKQSASLNSLREFRPGDQKSILYLEKVHDILMNLAALNSRTAN